MRLVCFFPVSGVVTNHSLKITDVASGFRNEVKKAACTTCRLHYELDATDITITEEEMIVPDPNIIARVKYLLIDKTMFLIGTDSQVSFMIACCSGVDVCVQGREADFCHPGLEYMITHFFYGKENSVGNIFRDHEDFWRVPHQMVALAASAVSNFDTLLVARCLLRLLPQAVQLHTGIFRRVS